MYNVPPRRRKPLRTARCSSARPERAARRLARRSQPAASWSATRTAAASAVAAGGELERDQDRGGGPRAVAPTIVATHELDRGGDRRALDHDLEVQLLPLPRRGTIEAADRRHGRDAGDRDAGNAGLPGHTRSSSSTGGAAAELAHQVGISAAHARPRETVSGLRYTVTCQSPSISPGISRTRNIPSDVVSPRTLSRVGQLGLGFCGE